MIYAAKHINIFKNHALLLIQAVLLLLSVPAVSSSLDFDKKIAIDNEVQQSLLLKNVPNFSRQLSTKSNSELIHYFEKQHALILAKEKEIELKKSRIMSLVTLLLLLSLLVILSSLLAAFYWRRNIALEYHSAQVKADLNSYLFGPDHDDASLASQEEFRKQKMLLNERQQEILDLMAFGLSNKQIANRLFISENTVKYHIKNIYHLLNVKDRKTLWLSQS